VFGIERLWSAVSHICPPFTVQLVVEGAPVGGRLAIDRPTLQRAVDDAAQVNPGVRLRREGHLGWARWRTFRSAPPVRVVDGQRWSGRDEQGAPFLLMPLTPGGPTVEVLLVRGACDRLVFRGHHAVVDGRGLLHFAEDVFAVLRGETPRGASLDVVDLELARTLGSERRGREKPTWSMPTGMPRPVPRGTPMPWRRVRFEGPTRRFLPRLALAVHHASRAYTQEPLQIEVPVDLRRHLPEGVYTTANITGGARIDMPAVVEASDPLDAFVELLRSKAEHPDAAAPIVDTQLFRWLPTRTSVRILRKIRAKALETGKAGTSAILSNLGRYPLARLSCPRHTASSWYWVPSGGPVVPLFILVTGDGQGVELSVGMSPELATDGRLDGLVEGMLHHLTSSGERYT
jgi:hypothetical protein